MIKILKMLNSLFLSISFLTRIPLPLNLEISSKEWRLMPAFFPLVGLIISLFSIIPFIFLNYLPIEREIFSFFAAIGIITISTWLTRALHIDGFCDTIDAFSVVNATPEKRLSIMKDPHLGSTAVTALFLLLISKFSAIYFLFQLENSSKTSKIFATNISLIIISFIFSRLSMTILSFFGNYPRKNGTAANIIGKTSKYALFFAILFSLLALFFLFSKEKPQVLILVSLLTIFLTIINIFYWFFAAKKMLDGVTGDILGALSETTETSLLLSGIIVLNVFFK